MSPERLAFVEQVHKLLDEPLTDLTSNKYTKHEVHITFPDLMEKIDDLRYYARLITNESVELLTNSQYREISKLTHILNIIRDIQNIKVDINLSQQQYRASFNGKFNSEWDENYNSILNAIRDSQMLLFNKSQQQNEVKNRIIELDKIIQESRGEKADFQKDITNYKNEFESAIASVKDELAKGGVGKHSEIFITQSGIHKANALKWKIGFIVLLCLNFIDILLTILTLLSSKTEKDDRLEIGILGLAVASIISFAVAICVRNYYAEKHNQTINQHKANCLGTFNTFIDAADSDKKAAILLQATQTIFSHQKSGYINKDVDVSSPSPIIEMISKLR